MESADVTVPRVYGRLENLREELQFMLRAFREFGMIPPRKSLVSRLQAAHSVLLKYRRQILTSSLATLALVVCDVYQTIFYFSGDLSHIRRSVKLCGRLLIHSPRTRNGKARHWIALAKSLVISFEKTDNARSLRHALQLCKKAHKEVGTVFYRCIEYLVVTGRVCLRHYEKHEDEDSLAAAELCLSLALDKFASKNIGEGHERAACESLYAETLRRLYQRDRTGRELRLLDSRSHAYQACMSVNGHSSYLPERLCVHAATLSTNVRDNDTIAIAILLLEDAESYDIWCLPLLKARILATRAALLLARFILEGSPADKDNSITAYETALRNLIPGSSPHIRTTYELSKAHRTIASSSSNTGHLDEAISVLMRVKDYLTVIPLCQQVLVVRGLCNAHIERGDRLGDIYDLRRGVSYARSSARMCCDSKAVMTSALAQAGLARRSTSSSSITDAVVTLQNVHETLDGNTDDGQLYSIVSGQVFQVRAEHDGSRSMWTSALASLQAAALSFDEGTEWNSDALLRLGICYLERSKTQPDHASVYGDVQEGVVSLQRCAQVGTPTYRNYGVSALAFAVGKLEELRERR